MSQEETSKMTEKEFHEYRKGLMGRESRGVHNALLDVRIQAYREAVEFLQKKMAELEADKMPIE